MSQTKESIKQLIEKKRQGTANKTAQLMPSKEMVKGQKGKSSRRKSGILG
ncbi:MAG: hypothetical protein ACRCST_02560 [Turicibacter sp.]